jgi:hypothetical protein
MTYVSCYVYDTSAAEPEPVEPQSMFYETSFLKKKIKNQLWSYNLAYIYWKVQWWLFLA